MMVFAGIAIHTALISYLGILMDAGRARVRGRPAHLL
jgi:hypothetical protein